jgi:hypothetical protein
MPETEHPSFFRTHKVLALLPLALMGAGVWYYVQKQTAAVERADVSAAPAPGTPALPAAPYPQTLPPRNDANSPGTGLDIQGSAEFKSQVTHALKLIWLDDRDNFLFIKRNLYIIRSDTKTGFYRENGIPAASISNDHAFRSLPWCAGIIAHQAWHSWATLTTRKKAAVVPPAPGESAEIRRDINPAKFDYKGMEAILESENKAFAFQLEMLHKTGASQKEIKLVMLRAPRDFTAGHDGSYDLTP